MNKKVFVLGDSSCADLAGAKIPKVDNPYGNKNIIIDDLDITFSWAGGVSAYSMSEDKYKIMISNLKNKIDEESLVILFFGGIDFEVYLPTKKNTEDVVKKYFETSYNFFKKITPNVLYIETMPPCKHFSFEIKTKYPIKNFQERYFAYNNFKENLKNKCLENKIPKPFSISEKTLFGYEKIHKVHTNDGFHLYKNVSELGRLDFARWIKENKHSLNNSPKETWYSYGSNDPWES